MARQGKLCGRGFLSDDIVSEDQSPCQLVLFKLQQRSLVCNRYEFSMTRHRLSGFYSTVVDGYYSNLHVTAVTVPGGAAPGH